MAKKKTKKSSNGIFYRLVRYDDGRFRSNVFFMFPFYLFLSLVILYHFVFSNRIIPGVVISGINVGGMTASQAERALLDQQLQSQDALILNYEGQSFEFTSDELELRYDIKATVARALEVGRTGNLFVDSKDKLAGLAKPLELNSKYSYNENALSSALAYIESQINFAAKDAYFYLEDGELKINPAIEGKKVSSGELNSIIISDLDDMALKPENLPVSDVIPNVTDKMLESYKEDVARAIANPMFIRSGSKTFELSPEELLAFIDVIARRDSETGTVYSELRLNEPVFESYANLVAQGVNVLPRGEVTLDEKGNVVGLNLITDGAELDVDKFKDDFTHTLFADETVMELSLNTISGPSDPDKYGIKELIGEGVSEYTGSAASRAHNLNLAASRTNGVMVPPGEVYSFNNSVGEISGANGYASAYIISNGRTVLGDGGGVCQTSTTLFRAALNAGLPIVKRNPHAYRVRYYELDQPLGFDAAIYQPYLDFQFKNDTSGHVLIETVPDEENSRLTFRLYGTSDGREVALTEPVISGESPPPEPLYQDDPSLAKGVVRQVDFAAWGATSTFTRTVVRDGEVIIEDDFTTRYQPWRAIYLVGTKTD